MTYGDQTYFLGAVPFCFAPPVPDLAPVDPLEIELYPHMRSITPGEKSTINLRVWNRTFSKIKGSIAGSVSFTQTGQN